MLAKLGQARANAMHRCVGDLRCRHEGSFASGSENCPERLGIALAAVPQIGLEAFDSTFRLNNLENRGIGYARALRTRMSGRFGDGRDLFRVPPGSDHSPKAPSDAQLRLDDEVDQVVRQRTLVRKGRHDTAAVPAQHLYAVIGLALGDRNL
ncbi:MAG TPA: hypothetical protein VN106_04365, partial [Sphingomicrobium sp.]|nr:hypothetical protein [Sphingomicrobium sp.]